MPFLLLQEPSFRFQQSCGQSQVSITEEFGYFASTGGTQLCIQTQVQQQSTAIAIEEDQPCTQPDTRGPPIPDNPAAVAADPHATTPDLGMFGSTESSCTLAKPLFNIFLPKSEQRVRAIPGNGWVALTCAALKALRLRQCACLGPCARNACPRPHDLSPFHL